MSLGPTQQYHSAGASPVAMATTDDLSAIASELEAFMGSFEQMCIEVRIRSPTLAPIGGRLPA